MEGLACSSRGLVQGVSPIAASAPRPRATERSSVQSRTAVQALPDKFDVSLTAFRPRSLLLPAAASAFSDLGRNSIGRMQRQCGSYGRRAVGRRIVGPPQASAIKPTDGKPIERWWDKNMPTNMRDLHSTQEFVAALADAGDRLVVVEFFGTWCGSCRALYPKLCKLAGEYPEALFYKIDFDANKQLCKSLNIRFLPFFHLYRGAEGRVDMFSASISKLQRLKDALATHSTDRCSLGPPAGPEQVLHPDLVPEAGAAAASR